MPPIPGIFKERIRLARTLSPSALFRKILHLTVKAGKHACGHFTDSLFGTFDGKSGSLHRLPLEGFSITPWMPYETALRETTGLHLEHRFDLLGSGWLQVRHGMSCRGLEGIRHEAKPLPPPDPPGRWLGSIINRANLGESRRVWGMLKGGYTPIDWQLDFKSGYRWSERTWYMDIPFGHLAGVDVKVPWELARMQHLPRLAIAYAFSRSGRDGFAPPGKYADEFRNQVLDFIATNPPRFGVNWRVAMEAAIRAANWLLAYDIFRSQGEEFDAEFTECLAGSIHEHGKHILANLEWDPDWRGNHYLADVAGLTFISAHIGGRNRDAWSAFALRELVREVEHQFRDEGTNFEASTCYHRLSAEMVAYATAAALRGRAESPSPEASRAIPDFPPDFPSWYFSRLERMAEFIKDITKPDGLVPQVGDNDSGRFFILIPPPIRRTVAEAKRLYLNLHGYDSLPDSAAYWDEDSLDHGETIGALTGLLDCAGRSGPDTIPDPITSVMLAAAGRSRSGSSAAGRKASGSYLVGTEDDWHMLTRLASHHAGEQHRSLRINCPGNDLRAGWTLKAYPEFGLFLFRSPRLYLAVRCGVFAACRGAHAHNDQLAVELVVDGANLIADPGSYLYTPLPDRRNRYRSVGAHFVPRVGSLEPGRLDAGLFALPADYRATCMYYGPSGFAGMHTGFGPRIYRTVEIMPDAILVNDFGNANMKPIDPVRRLGAPKDASGSIRFSPGYGRIHA